MTGSSRPDAETIVVREPASGAELGRFAALDDAAVRAQVQAARAAQPAWAGLPVRERARIMLRFRDLLVEQADEIAALSCRETGRVLFEALLADILTTCDLAQLYARRAGPVTARRRVSAGWLLTKRCYETREPLGVIGIITPWNLPVLNSQRAVLAALVTGNAVVHKPSEYATLTALRTRELLVQAGVPEDVYAIATGDGRAGVALIEAGVDKVSFTGSVASGRAVAERAARRLVPVALELGGKDPMIVLPGADVERAAQAAVTGAFFNAGQLCVSIERAFVHERLYDEFVQRVADAARMLNVGDSFAPETDVGALTTDVQLTRIEAQLEDALQRGARVVCGGSRLRGAGRYFAPTVIADATPDMLVMREETFGPVLPIAKVSDTDEAVRLANDTGFALGASIWGPPRTAEALVPRVRAGMTTVNDALANGLVPGLSFGGVGESGYGSVYGDEGLREMTRPHAVLVDRAGMRHEFGWYPFRRFGVDRLRALIRLLHGRGLAARLAAVRGLLKG